MADITDAEAVIAQLVNLVKAQQGLLVAYRTGQSNRVGKHIDNAASARARLKELGIEL